VRTNWTRRRTVRQLTWLLLVPALALRALVPPGFMPGTSDGHHLTMQMCHGAGPLPTPAGHDGGGSPQHHDSPCVFAAAGTCAPPPAVAGLLGGTTAAIFSPTEPALAVFHRAAPRAHAARAPPVPRHFV